jgi:hypothetical protein
MVPPLFSWDITMPTVWSQPEQLPIHWAVLTNWLENTTLAQESARTKEKAEIHLLMTLLRTPTAVRVSTTRYVPTVVQEHHVATRLPRVQNSLLLKLQRVLRGALKSNMLLVGSSFLSRLSCSLVFCSRIEGDAERFCSESSVSQRHVTSEPEARVSRGLKAALVTAKVAVPPESLAEPNRAPSRERRILKKRKTEEFSRKRLDSPCSLSVMGSCESPRNFKQIIERSHFGRLHVRVHGRSMYNVS